MRSEPGAVWIMDHTEMDVPAADGTPCALSVRDLGSGCRLLCEPLDSPEAARMVRLPGRLSFVQGAPFVLKSDNGSAFITWLTTELLG